MSRLLNIRQNQKSLFSHGRFCRNAIWRWIATVSCCCLYWHLIGVSLFAADDLELASQVDSRGVFDRTVNLSVESRSIDSCLQKLCEQTGLKFKPDRQSLKATSFQLDAPASVEVRETKLHDAITTLVDTQTHPDVVAEVRGHTLFLCSAEKYRQRRAELMPDWLRNHSVQFDDHDQIVQVYLSGKVSDEVISRLVELPSLHRLTIANVEDLTLEGIKPISLLASLEKLELQGVGRPSQPDSLWTADELMAVVGKLVQLRHLVADNCGISDQGVRALKDLLKLHSLSLRQNQITDESLRTIGKFTELTALDVGCYVQHVNFGKNEFSDDGMSHIAGLQNLEHICLEGSDVSTLRLAFPKLKSLSVGHGFNGREITDRDIFLVQRFPLLESLSINSELVSDTGIATLRRLQHLSSLELNCPSVTNKGIARISQLPLRRLTLRRIQLNDAGLGYLAAIQTLESLTVFGANETTIAGFQQLKTLPRLSELWVLGLEAEGNRVGFAELQHLRVLHFEMANLRHWTQADLDRLGERLPNTQVSVGTGGGIYGPKKSGAGFGRSIP